MANILVHKIGSGKPANNKLATGEFGVDVGEGILWVGTDSGVAVELSGGDIEWGQIINVPIEIIQIIDKNDPDYISIADLEVKVDANKEAIDGILAELERLEGRIDANASNISTNAAGIAANKTKTETNAALISANTAQITANATQIGLNTAQIEVNTGEISDIWAALKDDLTGLTLGGQYDAANNLVRNPTTEGFNAGLTPDSALPATEGTKGIYVVVTTEGKLSGTGIAPIGDGKADGEMAYKGDWLVSDGVHGWVLFSFHTDATLWGMIGGDISLQEDLQNQFATKVGVDDTLGGGNYNL